MVLSGKVAVVTGGGNGIGRAIAIGMAAAGAKVVVNDYGVSVEGVAPNAGPAEEVASLIRAEGGEAVPMFESVASSAGGRRIVEAALDTYGRIDALVCLAGIMRPANIFDITEDEWDEVIATNLKGHFTTVQPACIRMRAQKSGSVIMFTSSGGLEGSPLQPNYAASKEGIIGLMRSVALTVAPDITCNAISPSARTRMTERLNPSYFPGVPENIVPVVNWLASDAARHVTGQVIAAAGNRISQFPQPRPARSMYRDGGWTTEQIASTFDTAIGIDPLLRYDRFVGKIAPQRTQ